MGIIKVWELLKELGPNPRWRATLKQELDYHRTRINDMIYGNGQLWTGVSDLPSLPEDCSSSTISFGG